MAKKQSPSSPVMLRGYSMIQLREKYKYGLVIPTSMGVRMTPLDRQPVHTSNLYMMHSTSAESNVGNIAASLGENVKLLTAFVKDSPIAEFIKGELRRRNLSYEGPEVDPDGPWGYRHQFNIADNGYGLRRPRGRQIGRASCRERV